MPYVVVNLRTVRGARLGLGLRDTPYGVRVVALDAYPAHDVRALVQEGDRIVSVDGRASTRATATADRLRRADGTVSVCLLRSSDASLPQSKRALSAVA